MGGGCIAGAGCEALLAVGVLAPLLGVGVGRLGCEL